MQEVESVKIIATFARTNVALRYFNNIKINKAVWFYDMLQCVNILIAMSLISEWRVNFRKDPVIHFVNDGFILLNI